MTVTILVNLFFILTYLLQFLQDFVKSFHAILYAKKSTFFKRIKKGTVQFPPQFEDIKKYKMMYIKLKYRVSTFPIMKL